MLDNVLRHHVNSSVGEGVGGKWLRVISAFMRQNTSETCFFSSFFRPQMAILIGAVLWEYDNGAQAINLNLKRSVLPSFVVKSFHRN